MKTMIVSVLALAAFGTLAADRPADAFSVKYDVKSGGVASLVFDGDAAKMNWVEGNAQWGLPSFAPVPGNEVRFRGVVESNGTFTAVWSGESLELTAVRRAEANVLHETYVFRNISSHPVYVKRGDLGIFATFNDSYDGAATCLRERCHTHLWCRGEGAYVRTLKMGAYPHGLALVLTQGALDSYSVTRFRHKESNDRGDFTLHPEPFKLEEGESYTLAWDVVAYADGNFRERLLGYPNACAISFENETVFRGEHFRLTAECGEAVKAATAELNGRTIPCDVNGRTVRIDVCPDFLGEANFVLTVNGRRYFARGWVSEPIATLIPKRIRRIIEQNQCRDKSSRLYGAYLIYDNEESRPFFNWRRRDWNASRERVGMALLLARWARRHPSAEIRESLKLYEDFLLREIVDAATGAVSDTIGHDDSRVRHYNTPWYVNFWWEMHALTGEARYLDLVEKGIADYFAKAGPDFYPIACNFAECVDTLARAGRDVTGLKRLLRAQADSMIARGDRSPSQEVNYEQTLVTPPTTVLSGYCRFIERDPAALLCVSNHIRTLCRFQGDQPDHRLNDISIRHWDEYWFGKRELYGDAFPHYWSCLTSHDFVLFAELTGDEPFRRRAEKGFRNLLCLFRPDGTATCAHAYPFSVTMLKADGTPEGPRIRGEFDDPWANDQDYGLYFALRDCFEGKKND